MGPDQPRLLVISCLAGSEGPRTRALGDLAAGLGPLDWLSEPLPFEHSSYYREEMGPRLSRRLAWFRDLVPEHALAEVKGLCQKIEARHSPGGNRLVNLDPGLISLDSFILASHKYAPQRVCLAPGIFAELTLLYQGGDFRPLAWTYLDYASDQVRRVLGLARSRYHWRIKGPRAQGGTFCQNP